jgi:hypothetical protein
MRALTVSYVAAAMPSAPAGETGCGTTSFAIVVVVVVSSS